MVAVWSFDWMFFVGAPAWQWLDDNVTLDRKIVYNYIYYYNINLEAPVTATFCSLTNFFTRTLLAIKYSNYTMHCLFLSQQPPIKPGLPHSRRFLDHKQRRTTVDRTPLDEWSVCGRDLYLTIHNTHNRETSMLSVGFEPTISADERPQTYALDRAATRTGYTMR